MNIEKSTVQRIVVLGANGGIGKQTVEQALDRGHTVIAVARNPDSLSMIHPKLTIQKGDVMKPETLKGIFAKGDAVISAIGRNSTGETTLYSQGNRHIMQAMAHADAQRLFVVSASGLEVNPTHNMLVRLATKHILQRILKQMYIDLERMEDIVKASDLTWTIMRPPRLTNDARTGKYRFSINDVVENGLKISRADVADFMLSNMDNKDIFGKTVELAY